MEKKNSFLALALMPTNRVNGFVKQLPLDCQKHEALIYGIRCREEAFALETSSIEKLQIYMNTYPKDAAIRYYLPIKNEKGSAKICSFTLQFETEPQLYAVWCQCMKVVASLSAEELKILRFAIYEDVETKQVCFQSYSRNPDDQWVCLMLNFAHNIQPDENEWIASEIKFEACDIKSNF